MRLSLHAARLAAALLLAGAAVLLAPARGAREDEPALRRLVGPFAALAARVQWIRSDVARVAGDEARALARAEDALALDPTDPRGWELLAAHLAFDLASLPREPSPERRLAWVRAALDVLARGERRARAPGDLARLAGLVLVQKALQDPELPWPGGVAGLWRDAARAFERAAELGRADAPALAASAREHAREAAAGRAAARGD